MIRRKVLVVDDELKGLSELHQQGDPRDETYHAVIEELNKIAPGTYTYEPMLCASEEQARYELRNIDHSSGELIAIVDLVLDQNDRFSEQGSIELLDDILAKSRQTFFTTRRLEKAKVGTLVKFRKANRSAGLFPYELLQQQPEEFAMLLHRGLDYHDEGQAIDYIEYIQNKGFNEINILLLSDFHFGDCLSSEVEIDIANVFSKLDDVIDDRRIDLIFLLGDFTDKGRSEGFSTAKSFLEKLSTLANFRSSPSDFIRLVPGNHDIVVPLALSANVTRVEGEYRLSASLNDADLTKYSLQPFHKFRAQGMKGAYFFGENATDDILGQRHWMDLRWSAFGFLMVGFDSNSFPTADKPVVGQINEVGLLEFRRLLAEIPRERRQELVILVLAHHYTGDGEGDRGISERDLLRKHCSELGFKGVLFINGDRHGDPWPQIGRQLSNGGTMPLEIAVPTFCQTNMARQEGAARGAILLTLVCDSGSIETAQVRSFGFREGGALTAHDVSTFSLARNGWNSS